MSRVGLRPITIPDGVTVSFKESTATVKGPKGTITKGLPDTCGFKVEDKTIRVTRAADDKPSRSMHGLTRTLLYNMVEGVSVGFEKSLEIVGVGYKAELKGKNLELTVGFSHLVVFQIPEGIKIEVAAPTQIKVLGIEKDKVGQMAADIRRVRPPEPYKGKGIKYVGEQIRRKAGKTAAAGA